MKTGSGLGWLIALCVSSLLTPLNAAAQERQTKQLTCSIEIGRSSFSPGSCTVTEADDEITFSWPGAGNRTYRGVFSLRDDSTADAVWNGFNASQATDTSLGLMRHAGSCWSTDDPVARICLYANDDPSTDVSSTASDFETNEENLVDPSFARSDVVTPPEDRSSFRGLFLGMPVNSIAASIDSDFTLSAQNTSGHELSQFAELMRGMQQGSQSIFVQKAETACAQVMHDGNVVTQITMYQCFFDLTGNITAEEFAQQVLERYPIRDGMQGRQQLLGDGAYRFRYTEYTGHTESERFVVSHHELFNRVELAVTSVSRARF